MDLHILENTYILDENKKQYLVIALDQDYGDGQEGRFLAASCETGKFAWFGLDECTLVFDGDGEDEKAAPRETVSQIIDKLTSNPTAKEWVDKIVQSLATKKTENGKVEIGEFADILGGGYRAG